MIISKMLRPLWQNAKELLLKSQQNNLMCRGGDKMNLLYWNLKSNKTKNILPSCLKSTPLILQFFQNTLALTSVLLRIHCYQTLIGFIKDMVAVKSGDARQEDCTGRNQS